jgi:NADH-quinone oxidoreductase subunit N
MQKGLNATSSMGRVLILGLLLFIAINLGKAKNMLSNTIYLPIHNYDYAEIGTNIILCVITIFSLGLLLITREPLPRKIQPGVIVIFLGIIFGYMIALKAETFFYLYLALEISAFSTYALIATNTKRLLSIEGGIKYFLGTSISSLFFLLGISILYLLTSTMNIRQISNIFAFSNDVLLFHIGLLMIVIALISKLAMAPLHWFTIDAYQSASLFVSSFLMTVPKTALLLILSRLMSQFPSSWLNCCILLLMLVTLVQQTVQAFGQIKLRRFVVFTMTVNNVILIAPLLIASKENSFSILPSLLSYFLPLMLLFYVLEFLVNPNETVNNLSLIQNPIILLGLLISVISFAGVPIFGGFLLKYFILVHLLSYQELGLIVVVLVITLLPMYYYLRIALTLFFTTRAHQEFTDLDLSSYSFECHGFSTEVATKIFGILCLVNIIIILFEVESIIFL